MIKSQIELEKKLVKQSFSKFRQDFEKAKSNNTFGSTKTAITLISIVIEGFVQAIEAYINDYSKGRAVRSTISCEVISRLKNIQTVALVTARIILNGLFQNRSIQSVYREIGQGLEDEWKMQQCKKENLAYYNKILADMRRRGAKGNRIKTVMNFAFSKSLDFHTETWSVSEKIHAGMVLVHLFLESTGLIEITDSFVKGKHHKQIQPSDKLLECIDNLNSKLELLHPQFLPMICKPKEWTGIFDGGYVSPYMKRNKLIKNNSKDYLKKLANTPMPEVYSAINHIHNPNVFKTQIPIQLDGTCNGLQHYSALLKDEVGGKAVNLINSDKPSDIYEEVAKKLKNKLQAVQDSEILAKKWLELGFDRKLTKRPVMVLPYGGSEYSCREFIANYLQENYSLEYIWKHFGIGNNPNDSLFKVSLYLSKYLWRAIEDTLGAAIEGMNYLKKVAREI